ncbi:MAG TPA: hypothetical protein VD887_03775 [Allosphingosinicella sp.]|nr:hypothetical protein [Allosphingosinicella sp.]
MKQSPNAQRASASGAATDEPVPPFNPNNGAEPPGTPADPRFATPRAEEIYWAGVRHGIKSAGREPGHPHMPADFNLNLTRNGDLASLTSGKFVDAFPYAPDEGTLGLGHIHGEEPSESGVEALSTLRAVRHDGWTDAKVRLFLETLAETGVVADACRAARMSRDAAYAFRRRASGRAFALAWDAALLLSRSAIGDDVIGRSRYGVVDKVYRNGELVAERHRYDNRLTMAVLARLDRQAEGLGENAPVVRAVAQEWDRFLDLVPEGIVGAQAFVEARFPPATEGAAAVLPLEEPETLLGGAAASGTESALLARLSLYEHFGAGLPEEVDTDDLDPERMADWSDEQWERANLSKLLDMISPLEWPEAARRADADGTDGMCKLRKLYLRYHPEKSRGPADAPAEPEDDFADCSVWEEEEGWRTDFPPPADYDGWEEGEPGSEDYRRELSEEELRAVGLDDDAIEEERLAILAEQHAARERFFFGSGRDEAAEPVPRGPSPVSGEGGAQAEGLGG